MKLAQRYCLVGGRRRVLILLSIIMCCLSETGRAASQADFIVNRGEDVAFIYAPGPNEWAGWRLHQRILEWTSATLPVFTGDSPPKGGYAIAIGTPETNMLVRRALEDDSRLKTLGDQGYLLQVLKDGKSMVLAATGNTIEGVNNAVSELLSWHIKIKDGESWVSGELNQSERPGLKYRLLWGQSNDIWAPTLRETIEIQEGRQPNPTVSSAAGFLDFSERAVDYLSDHKINGYIWYYILNDEHGGLAAAQEMSRYARRNNLHVLPGVATMTAYHGFSMNEDHIYNFKEWNRLHPELRLVSREGEFVEGICPSKKENQQWLRDGMSWYLGNLPDLGGVNLENGDWIICWCKDCEAARHRPENDPNFFWDQLATYKPCLEKAYEQRPDMWLTFAVYSGFSPGAIDGAMHGARVTKRAAGDSERIVYPPKAVKQYPENSICQWTLTGMASPQAWPEGLKPPETSFKEQVGLIHQSSPWGAPVDKARWWADPGAYSTWDETTELIRFMCSRINQAGMQGLVIKGIIGASAPAKDLNFLALEYFGWRPENTYEQFLDERLSVALGNREKADRYLQLLRNTTRDPAEIDRDKAEAEQTAEEYKMDPRVQRRWENLGVELGRRTRLARASAVEQKAKEAMGIRPTGPQDGYIVMGRSEVLADEGSLVWGRQDGHAVTPVGLHTLFGITAPDVLEAKLRIPLNDTAMTQDVSAANLKWVVQHIKAADDTRVTAADATSAGLGTVGVYREAGPLRPDPAAFVELDVTEQVKATIQNGHGSFAWRIEAEGMPLEAGDSLVSFSAVENSDDKILPDHRGARLIIKRQSMAGQ
jgi:hypothetical protein